MGQDLLIIVDTLRQCVVVEKFGRAVRAHGRIGDDADLFDYKSGMGGEGLPYSCKTVARCCQRAA